MRPIVLALSLGIIGVGLIVGAFTLGSYDTGFCPEHPSPPMFGHSLCDHAMTVDGVTFWIRATAEGILAVGAVLIVSGLTMGLYGIKSRENLPQNRLVNG
jgi:hypothetical protein